MYYFSSPEQTSCLFDFYKFYNPLSNSIISKIETLTENIKYEKGKTQISTFTDEEDSARRSYVKWIPIHPKTLGLFNLLSNYITISNNEFWNFELISSSESIQYTEYRNTDKGHYTWHQDLLSKTVNRKLSLVIQLSDPDEYEGGELQISIPKAEKNEIITVPKKKGYVVVFPSYLFHRVTPVTKGLRKSLVWWVGGVQFK